MRFMALLFIGLAAFTSGCQGPAASNDKLQPQEELKEAEQIHRPADPVKQSQIADSAQTFCGNCHAMPKPESFSARHWGREVQRGFDFYFASGRADLSVPKTSEIKDYFAQQAPQELVLAPPLPLDAAAAKRFQVTTLSHSFAQQSVAIAGLEVVELGEGFGKSLVFSDMRGGTLAAARIHAGQLQGPVVLGQLRHPSRVHVCQLNKDRPPGLLVADLGSFLPADHQAGRVVWLSRPSGSSTNFESEVLLENCGRVADVQSHDLDADGDLDLVVADFGWHETGSLLWLERVDNQSLGAQSFEAHTLDKRPGALESFITDLNGDGHADIMALIAQEFEMLVAYLGDGQGGFQPRLLFSAEDPAFGFSGMQWCDLDRDNDLDCILTNGDSFDSFEVKPYHSIRWLENKGNLIFQSREIFQMPGVHQAVATDIDNDGDWDIVAAAFLPRGLSQSVPSNGPMALVWLENNGQQVFQARPLQVGNCLHPALCTTDFNDDGRVDLAVANFYEDLDHQSPAIEIWLQQTQAAVGADSSATSAVPSAQGL